MNRRKQVYFVMERFETWMNERWVRLYLPNWTHRAACLIWGHCGIRMPSGNYCAYCEKDRPIEECS